MRMSAEAELIVRENDRGNIESAYECAGIHRNASDARNVYYRRAAKGELLDAFMIRPFPRIRLDHRLDSIPKRYDMIYA